jgi:transglutaminase-like putative cysteine protease
MKTLISSMLTLAWLVSANAEANDTLYYAVEQDGVLCGYAVSVLSPAEIGNRPATLVEEDMIMKISALGKSIEGKYRFTYLVDNESGRYTRHTSLINPETNRMEAVMTVVGDRMEVVSLPENDTSWVALPDDVLLENTMLFPHLIRDFVAETAGEKTYWKFSEIDAATNEVVYTLEETKTIELAGETYEALILLSVNKTTGIQNKIWIDAATGRLLRSDLAFRSVYLSDPGVVNRIGEADFDNKLFAKVGVKIDNMQAIEYVKVRARMQPSGLWLVPDDLNLPGQTFTGTVEENLVDGIFEVEHTHYDGTGAPPFPPNFEDEDLAPYLEPTDMIESDDTVLINKALEITSGATDSWEAATRLAAWVDREIGYDLPGGVTAARTYELRLGECGSHSNLLSAFCRAVGIPCRPVFGCMYVPNHGGAFCQHAWNEIYMGDVGWVPVDATVGEPDYVDCGHIRLGEWKSRAAMFNPIEMEIIDYRLAVGTEPGEGEFSAIYEARVGQYQGRKEILTVLIRNGSLALDVPSQMVFELRDPDDEGNWFFKLTPLVSVSFCEDDAGEVDQFVIHQRTRLTRANDENSTTEMDMVPEEYRPLLGTYNMPMQNVTYSIGWLDEQLTLLLPGDKNVPLSSESSGEMWQGQISEVVSARIEFDLGTRGPKAMLMSTLLSCPRIASAETVLSDE